MRTASAELRKHPLYRASTIAGIAAKAAKEAAYHVERSSDWVVCLGDGTDESHARMQAAVDGLTSADEQLAEAVGDRGQHDVVHRPAESLPDDLHIAE
jgi:1,2-phenylacetyl-CoA epoxidase catalytic subunit